MALMRRLSHSCHSKVCSTDRRAMYRLCYNTQTRALLASQIIVTITTPMSGEPFKNMYHEYKGQDDAETHIVGYHVSLANCFQCTSAE